MKVKMQKTEQRFPFMSRFLTGIVIALALALTAFEWTTVTTETRLLDYDYTYNDDTEEILPPIRYQTKDLEKPKPKVEKPSDQIKVIENTPEKIEDNTETITEEPIVEEPENFEIDKAAYGMNDDDIVEPDLPYTKVQVFAHYNKCKGLVNDELMNCSKVDIQNRVRRNFRITPQLRAIGGRQGALVQIVIDKEGAITSIAIEQSTSKAMSRAARKAIEKLPKMNPAQQQGRNVSLSMKIPIVLSIQ